MALKEREMYNIKEKNARLRHIISEYNYFSEKKVYIPIEDPEWAQGENPVTVTYVTDKELRTRPYVSPSEQAILDARAAEEERLRLLLLADDFRERALMKMMNGVLEVRWEDELKKDVPKPKCMLEKDPGQYNEEDLRAIRDYDEKCAQLQVEREKYKSLLEVEFSKISVNLRDSIRKFNQKLWDCTTFKYYIDSGMNQENLQVNRARVIQSMRIDTDIKEKNIIETMKSLERSIERVSEQMISINEVLNECRGILDGMQSRDKVLEKAFKRDIQEMSPVIQEVAAKLYKKRPKVGYKNIATATVLYELSKGVISNERTIAMTSECLDYLKSLDQLDLFIGLPPAIDEHVYSLICKHRRLRIEYEIKLKAAQIQIAEGESTIHTFQKRLQIKKENVAKLSTELQETRDFRLYLMHNKQIQIVLRRGLVEIPLSGSIEDFKDAILIPKSEIEYINRLIVEAGQRKVKSIMTNMAFRRKVMATEWEHKRLRMLINDLIEQKRDIENVKFTKDMQNYLKNKALGRKPETESFEIEIELLSATYENRIREKREKYMKIKKQLNAYKESNAVLDKAIKEVNIDVCHFKLQKDLEFERREKGVMQQRIETMLRRSMLVSQIQQNHNEILVLQTELELLRLRTYPTFKYQFINES